MPTVHVSNFGFDTALRCSTKKGQYFIEPHLHQFSEIVFVKAGELSVTVDGVTETARENDVAFIGAFRTHTLKSSPDAEIWICVFSNDFIHDFKTEGDVHYVGERSVFTPSDMAREFFVSKFVDSAENFLEYNASIFRSMRVGIYAIYEEYTRLVPSSALPTRTESRSVLNRTLKHIHKNFKSPISLVSVAHDLGYNPEYISHALSAIEGMNFRYLVNSFRVEYAKTLLLTSKRTIPDISEECGFASERSFHRVFKSIIGKTPGEYRSEWKSPAFTTGKGDTRYATK